MNWFRRLCPPREFQNATLQTLQHRILLMPEQLRRTDNRPRLVLQSSGPREAAWNYALHQIQLLRLSITFYTGFRFNSKWPTIAIISPHLGVGFPCESFHRFRIMEYSAPSEIPMNVATK